MLLVDESLVKDEPAYNAHGAIFLFNANRIMLYAPLVQSRAKGECTNLALKCYAHIRADVVVLQIWLFHHGSGVTPHVHQYVWHRLL